MTIPSGATSGASDLSGMSGPHGMLTLQMSGRASSPVLVGRNEQMAALVAAFASVRQDGPSAVLLGGEAGVGKSRLVSEFSRTAAEAGARVLTGGCCRSSLVPSPWPRGDQVAAAQAVLAARGALSSVRYEDQHQLPLATLEILFALGRDGPAAALAVASATMDRFECPAAVRGTPGPPWPPGQAPYWPPPGWPGWRTTSGSATMRPPWPNGCGRWRRN